MNVTSVKTNTVLVSKNLAQAQFRCLECQKVFISYRHLEKHSLRRHHESLFNFNGSVVKGQHEAFSANDQKLIEVAGRLENVLSLLETKAAECVDRRLSTAWVDTSPAATSDHLSPILDGNCRNIYVLPSFVSDVRKPVSLFTLPNDRTSDPDFEGFGMEDAELRQSTPEEKNPVEEIAEVQDTDEKSKQVPAVNEEHETVFEHSTTTNGVPNSPENAMTTAQKTPSGIRSDHIEAAGSLGPLIVDLINKLEQVSIGPKQVTSACCQTSDNEKNGILASTNDKKRRKSVTFSEHPVTIENYREDSSFSDTESAEISKDEERIQQNNPVSSSESLSTDSPHIHVNTKTIDNYVANDENGKVVIEPPQEPCIAHDHVDCDHWEDDHTPQTLLRFPDVEAESDDTNITLESDVLKPEEPSCPQNSEKFAQTKQQILNLVEKCMQECKSNGEAISKSVAGKSIVLDKTEVANHRPGDQITNYDSHTPENLGKTKALEVEICNRELGNAISNERNASNNIVCVKYGSGHLIPGVVAPSSIICKDGGLDIDDMSGNSYEQFMKRFSSDFLTDRKIIEEQVDRISLACKTSIDSMSKHAATQSDLVLQSSIHSAIQIPDVDILPVVPEPVNERNNSETLVCHKSGTTGLSNTEYAVLLHHETSQVQSLIDTLITDVQRWRKAKKNEISKTIRVQLEESLSSNLSFLGIQNTAKSLSDTQMTTASFLLNNRRSKAVMGAKTSYFDTLKTAFEIEIDRIAKSRPDYQF